MWYVKTANMKGYQLTLLLSTFLRNNEDQNSSWSEPQVELPAVFKYKYVGGTVKCACDSEPRLPLKNEKFAYE